MLVARTRGRVDDAASHETKKRSTTTVQPWIQKANLHLASTATGVAQRKLRTALVSRTWLPGPRAITLETSAKGDPLSGKVWSYENNTLAQVLDTPMA
jgi:hypothetical protein